MNKAKPYHKSENTNLVSEAVHEGEAILKSEARNHAEVQYEENPYMRVHATSSDEKTDQVRVSGLVVMNK